MATEKLSTGEILALARRQGAFGVDGGSPAASAGEPAAAADTPPAESEPPPRPPAKATSAAPSATSDILAAARAQGAQGGADSGESAAAASPAPTAAKPAAAPKSTADILAAARSQGSTGAAKPAPSKAKPAAPPKSKPAAGPASGEHPSVQDMVRAMHQTESAPAAPAVPVPARRALPGKPPLPKKKKDTQTISRGAALVGIFAILLSPFYFGWSLVAVIGGLWSLLGARFMMPNMVVELPSKFKVGPPSDFPPGAVSEKFKASRGVWIVNSSAYNGEQEIYALYSVCTHLGCTPNWLEGEQKFKCPCHGSGFYISGINFEGPAPRPLERAGIKLAEDGSLEVDKSVKFQEELGQWQDGKSYFEV